MKERILNFSEREGLKPLPDAYQLEELSYEVRNELKYIFEETLNKFFGFYREGGAILIYSGSKCEAKNFLIS